jgi:hypothetical protein
MDIYQTPIAENGEVIGIVFGPDTPGYAKSEPYDNLRNNVS